MGSAWKGPNNVILHDYKLCYMAIPKVCTTSIKKKMAQESGLEKPSRFEYAGKIVVRDSGYLAFSVVRHPFTRAVSGWLNKFQNEVDPPPLQRYSPYGFDFGMGFADFVDVLCDYNDEDMDVHFQSQAHCLVLDGIKVPSLIGRFETLDRGWGILAAHIQHHCGLDISEIGHYRQSAALETVKKVLTADLRVKLYERYKKDFEYFGYSPVTY